MQPFLDATSIVDCFSTRLRRAREAKKLNQEELGEKLKLGRVSIANYERGRQIPDSVRAVKLAEELGEDPCEFVLLADAQRSASDGKKVDLEFLNAINRLFERYRSSGTPALAHHGLASHVSLLDFPDAFAPLTIIVGDKREEEPRNAGDLYVFSASTVDDRWIFELDLPRNTEKLSDKILMTASDEWLKTTLGRRHILCIGSPASNLFARAYNDHFLFRFALSPEAKEIWKKKRAEMAGHATPAALLGFREASRPDLKQTMRLFKQPGFVDFNYHNLRLGIDPAENRDFAVVSIGRNPWAGDEPFFAILAAGVHHPGTAHAVRFLATPENFRRHPFGGVLEVQVPSDHCEAREVFWHNKIEKSVATWHSAGQSDLSYEPQGLRLNLTELIRRLETGERMIEVVVAKEECEKHIQLIDRLAAARSPGGSS